MLKMAATVTEHLLVRALTLKNELTRFTQAGNLTSETLDYLRYQSEMLYEHAVRLSPLGCDRAFNEIIPKLREVSTIIRAQGSEKEQWSSSRLSKYYSGNCGRPKFLISQEQLEYLIANGFNAVEIGRLLGVSLSTVRRRMIEYSIDTSRRFSDITDENLCELIRDIKKENPRSGYRMMLGHLRARGYRVTQLRVRQMMQKEDPEGTVTRWMTTVQRRAYSVSGPNALWHIDGNHKLIRYEINIHITTAVSDLSYLACFIATQRYSVHAASYI